MFKKVKRQKKSLDDSFKNFSFENNLIILLCLKNRKNNSTPYQSDNYQSNLQKY